jgi:hypothetical protein
MTPKGNRFSRPCSLITSLPIFAEGLSAAGSSRWIDVASGDVPDSVGHRQQREPERERHSGEADSQMGKAGGKDGAAASAKHQPKRSDEFGPSAPRISSGRKSSN